jgi:hypothetical protein
MGTVGGGRELLGFGGSSNAVGKEGVDWRLVGRVLSW